VATAGADGTARLWELPSGALRRSCAVPAGLAQCLAFSGDGHTLAVGVTANSISVGLWDPVTGTGRGVLTSSGTGSTRPRCPAKAAVTGEHAFYVAAVAFSPDGATLAAAGSDGVIHLWDVSSGERCRTFSGHVGAVRRLAFAPDGRTLATLGADKTVQLWHLGTGQRLFSLDSLRHKLECNCLAFSRDGRLLVAGGRAPGDAGASSLLLWRTEPAGQ
jgi:WD40 repeat protein